MPYVLAAAAAFVLFARAEQRGRPGRAHAAPVGSFMRGSPLPQGFDAGLSPAEVSASIFLALKRLLPVMAGRGVRADVAVKPGLMVPMAAGDLADLLEALLAAAVHHAPACRLVGAGTACDGRIHISVTDDGGGADSGARATIVEGLARRAALHGGALDVEARPAEGTTMTLRLAAADAGSVAVAPRRHGRPSPQAAPVLVERTHTDQVG